MFRRLVLVVMLSGILAFVLAWGAAAQGPEPNEQPEGAVTPMPVDPESGRAAPYAASAAAIAVGQPGLSYRYLETFGISQQGYSDPGPNYINGPSGLFIDAGDNVYVTESRGKEVLKFNSSGTNLVALGTAGLCVDRNSPAGFCDPQDVAVDGSGNFWVATSSRVVQYDSTGAFQRQLPSPNSNGSWSSGSDNTHFNGVGGVALDNTSVRLFVSDQGNQRIQIYTFNGSNPVYSTTIGVTGVSGSDNSHFNNPGRLAVDSLGRLYVVDQSNRRIQRCALSGSWSCTTFLSGFSNGVLAIAVDNSNNVYTTGVDEYRVQRCDAGANCTTFITGVPSYIPDVAVDSAGNVYVSSSNLAAVRKYNSGGALLGNFIGTDYFPYSTDSSHIYSPWGLAVGADGSIYVGERFGDRVMKLNAAGVQQWAVGSPGVWGSLNNQFNSPQGKFALLGNGQIYIPDSGNGRIQIFTIGGSYVSTVGSQGSGSSQFNGPSGIAINPVNGDIYVADSFNHRVQVFDMNWIYKATLGVTGVSGGDNAHFNQPRDVAIDSNGNIFVADRFNRRVQKCSLSGVSYSCATFAGVTGFAAIDYDHLSGPTGVIVDGANRVFVADENNHGVMVYDAGGAYLTTVGYSYGSASGQMRNASGIALDSAGNLYVADRENHRIQKFAPGVPSWVQRNVNGFGNRSNAELTALASFGGQLYAGTEFVGGTGAQIWRTSDAVHWTPVITNGFGITRNASIDHLYVFGGQLYAGTWADAVNGGEIWRSSDGNAWNQVVAAGFGDTTNGEVYRLIDFNSQLYASTWSYTNTHGADIWRSPSGNAGDWTRVVTSGFGVVTNTAMLASEVYSGYLYAGFNGTHQIWRSSTGDAGSWGQVDAPALGSDSNFISSLASFGGYLYAGTGGPPSLGSEIWRCQVCDGSDWSKVVDNGFGNPNNRGGNALQVLNGDLYAVTTNSATGMEVWRTTDGATWNQTGYAGFGDSNNARPYYDNSMTTFNGHLFAGTINSANGGELWELLDRQLFLPAIQR